jgi:hypothetical protein
MFYFCVRLVPDDLNNISFRFQVILSKQDFLRITLPLQPPFFVELNKFQSFVTFIEAFQK